MDKRTLNHPPRTRFGLVLLPLAIAIAGGCGHPDSNRTPDADAGDAAVDRLDAREDAGEPAREDAGEEGTAEAVEEESRGEEPAEEAAAEEQVEEVAEQEAVNEVEPEPLDVVEEKEEGAEIVAEPDAADMAEEEGPFLTPGFVLVPAGSFTMGSPAGEPGRAPDETQHFVTLTVRFEMMAREVTQGEFQARVGRNPSSFPSCGASCPVEQVSWHEALDYANLFSAFAGKAQCFDCTGSTTAGVSCSLKTAYARPQDCPGFRLPTEAEWEHAARATTTTAFSSGPVTASGCSPDANLVLIGWYCNNCGVGYAGCYDLSGAGGSACSGPHPVGGKQANLWGLFDMSGNVFEWVWDWYRSDYELLPGTDPVNMVPGSISCLRGGGWIGHVHYCRSADRGYAASDVRSNHIGFRLVRSLP